MSTAKSRQQGQEVEPPRTWGELTKGKQEEARKTLLEPFIARGVTSREAQDSLIRVFRSTAPLVVATLGMEKGFAEEIAVNAQSRSLRIRPDLALEATIILERTFVSEVAAFAQRRANELQLLRRPDAAAKKPQSEPAMAHVA